MSTKKGASASKMGLAAPINIRERYQKWFNNKTKLVRNDKDRELAPVFVPVYPGCPGYISIPCLCQGDLGKKCPYCGHVKTGSTGINPYILFLILILLIIIFRKEQILAAIKKLLLS